MVQKFWICRMKYKWSVLGEVYSSSTTLRYSNEDEFKLIQEERKLLGYYDFEISHIKLIVENKCSVCGQSFREVKERLRGEPEEEIIESAMLQLNNNMREHEEMAHLKP